MFFSFRLNTVLGYAEDMEIDIPKIWQYLGELIGPMVQDGSLPLSFLKEACQPLKDSDKSGILVAEILHEASDREVRKLITKQIIHYQFCLLTVLLSYHINR